MKKKYRCPYCKTIFAKQKDVNKHLRNCSFSNLVLTTRNSGEDIEEEKNDANKIS